MAIHWLTIFFLLLKIISINSDQFAARNSSAEDRQWTNSNTNNINFLNGSHQSLKTARIYLSKGIKKIPTNFSHQETMNQRSNKSKGMSSENSSYEKWIANLSKLAKVQSAGKDFPTTGRVQVQNVEGPTLFNSLVSSRLRSNYNTSNTKIKQTNVRCYAIPKTAYMPEINEFILAYACKLGNKIFIVSSKRFFEDRRNSVLINIDDETLDKINSPATDTESGKLRIIPSTLVLQVPGFNYYIRNRDAISREEHNKQVHKSTKDIK